MKKVLSLIRKIFYGTYIRGFVSSYLIFMVIGATLLRLPISLQPGVELVWVDALFTAASALSTTGLSTIVVRDTLTIFGQVVLLLIIQFGGIGLIMMVSLFWLVARKKIGFKQRNMMMTDQNQLSRQGIVRFVKSVLIMIFLVEAVAFVIITSYLYLAGYFPIGEALFQALFLTISLFTNAGFDIAPGGDSLQMFRTDYFMQTTAMMLMFLGAVGFWPLSELKEFIVAKWNKETFKFSVFVKTLVILHLSIWLVSALILFGLERTAFLADKGFLEGLYYTLFMSLTTRNAGFSTMEVTQFSGSTHILFVMLMFIGASPNSAGGGIRTTTLLLVIFGIKAYALGDQRVIYKARAIKEETVYKSFVAALVGVAVIMTFFFALSVIEPHHPVELAFEVSSAFGTTGLSLGITPYLNTGGKTVLVAMMFIGRIGVLALLLMFKPDKKGPNEVEYPEMDMIVG